MKCSDPEKFSWSTGETATEYADWDVCRTHAALLRSGEDFATHSDLTNPANRWLVMGKDLEVRQADTLQGAMVSVEYTGSGKQVGIVVTTGRGIFEVIFDQDQATEVGKAIADMTIGMPAHQ